MSERDEAFEIANHEYLPNKYMREMLAESEKNRDAARWRELLRHVDFHEESPDSFTVNVQHFCLTGTIEAADALQKKIDEAIKRG